MDKCRITRNEKPKLQDTDIRQFPAYTFNCQLVHKNQFTKNGSKSVDVGDTCIHSTWERCQNLFTESVHFGRLWKIARIFAILPVFFGVQSVIELFGTQVNNALGVH